MEMNRLSHDVRTLLVKVGLALPAIFLALQCRIVTGANVSDFQLVDSGFPSNESLRPYWLDDKRVIFKGFEIGSYSKEMRQASKEERRAKGYNAHGMHTGYYIWDTEKNRIEFYKDKIANLCVQDHDVIYRTDDGSRSIVWAGKFAAERPVEIRPERLRANNSTVNCSAQPVDPTTKEARYIVPLHPGWGYLDLGPADQLGRADRAILYFRDGESTPQKLDLSAVRLMNGGRVIYAPHEDRHLLVEGSPSLEPSAWFLSRDGALTQVSLPTGPWRAYTLYPVKDGIFISSAHTVGEKVSMPGGAYLVSQDRQWRLLFKGVQGAVGISPDGCRVALTVSPDAQSNRQVLSEWKAGRPGLKTMRMIDFCQGASK